MTFPLYPIQATPIPVPSLPDGTIPLPVWAYGTSPEAAKADPGNTKRELGWTTVPDQTYGEQPPLQWQNNEMFNNGQWATYFKEATDYLKAGNFDNGIHVSGNSELYNNLTLDGSLLCLGGIKDGNRSGIYFYNLSGSLYTAFFADNAITSNDRYQLPISLPPSQGLPMICNIVTGAGVMSWGAVNAKYIYGNSGIAPTAGYIGYQKRSAVTNVPISPTAGFWTAITSITLDIGTYSVSGLGLATTAGFISLHIGLSTSSNATTPSDAVLGDNYLEGFVNSAVTKYPLSIPEYVINITSNSTIVYLNMASSSNDINASGRISAILIG